MSYEIVKSISIRDNKVFINCASNNVRPLYYTEEEYPYYTKILQEKGEKELQIALLKSFEEGNLQSSLNNKYTRALKVLHYIFREEHKKFDWNNFTYEQREEEDRLRNSDEFKELLWKALNTKLPKQKFIVYNPTNRAYVRKETSRHIYYGLKPKVYDFREQAERVAKHISYLEVKELNELKEVENDN